VNISSISAISLHSGELSLKCGYSQWNHCKVMKAGDGRLTPRKFSIKSRHQSITRRAP